MAELTNAEKYEELIKVIPLNCNIVRGFIGPELDVDTVGILTPDGIAALSPFFNVDPIIDHYWDIIVVGEATVVINAGKPSQSAYKRDECGWVKDTSVKLNTPDSNKPRILTLADLHR